MEYQKLQTVFKRDEKNIIIPDMYTLPEIEYLKHNVFECTEKIDGTNIRIEVKGTEVTYAGRTSRAVIPTHLLSYLQESFPRELVLQSLGFEHIEDVPEDYTATIYGEGYGVKIQTGGGNYLKDKVGFILFDVKIGNWWLKRENCEIVANTLKCPIVPIIGYMTLLEAIEYVKKGFKSTIACNPNYDAEGLVLRTPCGLLDRGGNRLIFKVKTCDFRKWDAAYGNIENPVQVLNKHLENKNA
jgi:hypothetical protein